MDGRIFGKWTVVGAEQTINGNKHVSCRCECGKEKLIYVGSLTHGFTSQCRSCANKQARHGHARSTGKSGTYICWRNMVRRCRDPRDKSYAAYGGAGIAVCDSWLTFDGFITDMGSRPSRKHSIDRIDALGSYAPGNCRWVTRDIQNHNKRPASNTGEIGVYWRGGRGHFEWVVTRGGLRRSGISRSLSDAVANRSAAAHAMYGDAA